MKVAVIGAGYVGLVTASCLAELGHEVVCMDSDPARVELLRAGGVPALHFYSMNQSAATLEICKRLGY